VNVVVRPAQSTDTPIIVAFNCQLASESENRHLDQDRVAAGVAALFKSTERGQYFVAEVDGAVVAQLLITYEWSDWRNGMFWWIQSVYVVAKHRRSGVFSNLYQTVSKLAKQDPTVCGLRLYVEQENDGARDTYLSRGMSMTGYEVMEIDFTRS
jgi:ribosomal protein S18 acetylase RimI-like enzyme